MENFNFCHGRGQSFDHPNPEEDQIVKKSVATFIPPPKCLNDYESHKHMPHRFLFCMNTSMLINSVFIFHKIKKFLCNLS